MLFGIALLCWVGAMDLDPIAIRTVDNNLPFARTVARRFELGRFLPASKLRFDKDFYYRLPVEGARQSYGHLYYLDMKKGQVGRNLVITCPDKDVFSVFLDDLAQRRDAEVESKGQLHYLKHNQSDDPRRRAIDYAVRYTDGLILIGRGNDKLGLGSARRLINRARKYSQFTGIDLESVDRKIRDGVMKSFELRFTPRMQKFDNESDEAFVKRAALMMMKLQAVKFSLRDVKYAYYGERFPTSKLGYRFVAEIGFDKDSELSQLVASLRAKRPLGLEKQGFLTAIANLKLPEFDPIRAGGHLMPGLKFKTTTEGLPELPEQLELGSTTLQKLPEEPTTKPSDSAPLFEATLDLSEGCLLYTSPSPRDRTRSRMPSSA